MSSLGSVITLQRLLTHDNVLFDEIPLPCVTRGETELGGGVCPGMAVRAASLILETEKMRSWEWTGPGVGGPRLAAEALPVCPPPLPSPPCLSGACPLLAAQRRAGGPTEATLHPLPVPGRGLCDFLSARTQHGCPWALGVSGSHGTDPLTSAPRAFPSPGNQRLLDVTLITSGTSRCISWSPFQVEGPWSWVWLAGSWGLAVH